MENQLIALIGEDVLVFIKPWIIPSLIIIMITYAALRLIKRRGKKLPHEVEELLPIALAILFQFLSVKIKGWYHVIDLLKIGFAHGAVITSIYAIAIKRIKKKIAKDE